jgi:hypothetical protein
MFDSKQTRVCYVCGGHSQACVKDSLLKRGECEVLLVAQQGIYRERQESCALPTRLGLFSNHTVGGRPVFVGKSNGDAVASELRDKKRAGADPTHQRAPRWETCRLRCVEGADSLNGEKEPVLNCLSGGNGGGGGVLRYLKGTCWRGQQRLGCWFPWWGSIQ